MSYGEYVGISVCPNRGQTHLLFLSDGREVFVMVLTQIFIHFPQDLLQVFRQTIFIQFPKIDVNAKLPKHPAIFVKNDSQEKLKSVNQPMLLTEWRA